MLQSIPFGQLPTQPPALWLRPVAGLTAAFSALREKPHGKPPLPALTV